MKYFIIIIISSFSIFSDKLSIGLKNDTLFYEFRNELKTDWEMKFFNDKLLFVRKEPIYILPLNKFDRAEVSSLTEEKRKSFFIKKGMRVHSKLIFQILKRKNVLEEVSFSDKKEKIESELRELPVKYKVDELIKNKNLENQDEIVKGKKKADRKRLVQFFKKRKELIAELPLEAEYRFDKYELYLIEREGIKNKYSAIYPDSVTGEILQIEKYLYKYRIKPF
jgi:hypothetical protein